MPPAAEAPRGAPGEEDEVQQFNTTTWTPPAPGPYANPNQHPHGYPPPPSAPPGTAWPPSPDPAGSDPWIAPSPTVAGVVGGPGGPGGAPAPPRRKPPDPSIRPDRRALVVLVVVAIAIDLMLRTSVRGLAAAVAVMVTAVGLVLSGRLPNRWAKAAALATIPFGWFLVLRTSPWLVVLDLAAITALFGAAAVFARSGSFLDVRGMEVAQRLVSAFVGLVLAPAFVCGAIAAALPATSPAHRQRRVAIARGIGLAVPALVVLGLLLASSDAVFASLFHLPADGDSVTANGLLVVLGLWIAGALLRAASEPAPPPVASMRKPLGAIEARIVLGGLIVLYGAFALTQVVTARGGAEYVIRTANLTRADYARSGFFQLLAVAGLTLLLLVGIKSLTEVGDGRRTRRTFVIMSELAIGLTLVIVAVAIIRLNLYDDAYGLTMLRLFSVAAAWWLGVVFVLVGLALGFVGRDKHWLLGTIVLTGLLALFALNALDPEAYVVNHNAALFEAETLQGRAADFDVVYTATLSDDAVPALRDALRTLDADRQRAVVSAICFERDLLRSGWTYRDGAKIDTTAPDGWQWNRASADAARVRQELCP